MSSSRANQALRSLANSGFQNQGVCLQAFPSFPSPSPLFHFLLSFHFSLLRNSTETLATQATYLMPLDIVRGIMSLEVFPPPPLPSTNLSIHCCALSSSVGRTASSLVCGILYLRGCVLCRAPSLEYYP